MQEESFQVLYLLHVDYGLVIDSTRDTRRYLFLCLMGKLTSDSTYPKAGQSDIRAGWVIGLRGFFPG